MGASLFEKRELPVADAGRKLYAVQPPDIEVAGRSSPEDEAGLPKTSHLVEEPEVLDHMRCLVELTVSDLRSVFKRLQEYRAFVNLTVVLAHLPLMEADASSYGLEVPRDAASIDAMRLGESRGDARVLRQIAAGVLNRQAGMRLAHALEQCPTHDVHEGFRSERMSALDLQLDLPCVTGLVADLAERDQIVGGIAADLTAFEVVHVEDLVLRMTVTVLAKVTVSKDNVFKHVPKAEQIALLIVRAFNSRIFDLLNVERCRLNHDHD